MRARLQHGVDPRGRVGVQRVEADRAAAQTRDLAHPAAAGGLRGDASRSDKGGDDEARRSQGCRNVAGWLKSLMAHRRAIDFRLLVDFGC